MSNSNLAARTVIFSMLGNALLAAIKFTAGIFGHSYALIADGIESVVDVFASLLVLVGLRYSSKPADENHPYGHGKAEPLITFLVVVFLIISACTIGWQAYQHIITPHESPRPFTLIVLAGIILWKEISFQVVMRRSKKLNSSALKAEAWHHRSDAITSVAAFVGIIIAVFGGEGFEVADDYAALFAVAFILFNCYRIFRPALSEVMDENNYEELTKHIREIALTVPGVKGTEKCFIRKAGMEYHVDLHALVVGELSVTEGHRISHLLKDRLCKEIPELGNVLIHIEPF
ncbi:cation diffusion facilitator family transporter [Algoriphagus halophytocola]|uniref:Cation diffusion facilitator family transporter n=1 Tax=Algoriphagus halophytocola TaxID=2991499 RepID=A0ABY6MHF7_9BACT|nr:MULTISPECIES: cation diffusion facilitator family transporter [unclassified Algoriphagus]UZD22633.1 cation diffusion facilitator family transporter [Algoriphagus sp. TR-M5]WBL43899.1 cation diffusion facilitator family transporter [Algoriphagus sp. TR-M9]